MHSVQSDPQTVTTPKPARLTIRIPSRGGVYVPTVEALAMREQIERWAQGLDGADNKTPDNR